ncbi:MAG TPA: response regulator transcription factor [Chitinophagaceae bacterium]|nr:response regulator transcription factor [Chitinophagaceae bacterium]
MKTILIADDHEIIRMSLRTLIETFHQKYNFIEAATCVETMQVLSCQKADYAILDVFMADGNILSDMQEMTKYFQHTSILVCSMASEKIYAKRFLKKGVRGFVSKRSPIDELEKAIQCFLKGEIYLSNSIKEDLLTPAGGHSLDSLSDRELQVVEYLAMGTSVQDITQKMKLDAVKIDSYRRRAFKKLNIKKIAELDDKCLLAKNGTLHHSPEKNNT